MPFWSYGPMRQFTLFPHLISFIELSLRPKQRMWHFSWSTHMFLQQLGSTESTRSKLLPSLFIRRPFNSSKRPWTNLFIEWSHWSGCEAAVLGNNCGHHYITWKSCGRRHFFLQRHQYWSFSEVAEFQGVVKI